MITHDARRSLSRGNNPVPSPWLATPHAPAVEPLHPPAAVRTSLHSLAPEPPAISEELVHLRTVTTCQRRLSHANRQGADQTIGNADRLAATLYDGHHSE